ncbi:MAG: NAD(P)-binding protein, partial [Thermodesulfobacteriota bacterium]
MPGREARMESAGPATPQTARAGIWARRRGVTGTKSGSYDVIIVGAGPAGLFCAYWLAEHTDLGILLLDKGR